MEDEKKNKSGVGVKILRLVIWTGVLILGPVGVALIAAGSSSKAIAENTDDVLMAWGEVMLMIALGLLIWNFVWGMKKWAEKWYESKWKVSGGIIRTIWGGVWRGAVFGIVILIIMVLIAPKVEAGITSGYLAKVERKWLTGQVGIEEDFRRGNITPDEYLRYMLAVGYGTEELPQKYKTDQAEIMPDILEIVEEYGERISKETLEMAIDAIYQTNIEVGLDASDNGVKREEETASMMDVVLATQPVAAYTKKATTLNKAVLSGAGNFVVYYTDTGDDAISDEKAAELAAMMENLVVKYEEKLGLEYSFTFHKLSGKNDRKIKEVLRNSGIDEEKSETAMAVYVANPFSEETSVLAFYSGEHLAEWGKKVLISLGNLLGVDEARWTKSVAGVPNITVLSSNLDDPSLELVVAHELGHHYQNLHCQAEIGEMCPAGKFATEGGANWLAINVVEEQPEENAIQSHHGVYIERGTCYKVDEILNDPPDQDACHEKGSFEGYPALAFLQNYYLNVSEATGKLMDALLAEDPLAYLREQATEAEFRQVVSSLAKKNLTNEYEEVTLWSRENNPGGSDLDCAGKTMCVMEFPLRPTAVKYVYLATEEYDRVKVMVTGTAEDMISILGKKEGKWEVISESAEMANYTAEKTGAYEAVAFAVANASVTNDGTFKVETIVEEVAEIIEEDPEKVDGCMVVDFQGLMDNYLAIGKSISGLLGTSGEDTGDTSAFEQDVDKAKQEMQGMRLMVCELQIKHGVSLDEVERRMRKTMWMSYKVVETKESGIETRAIVGVDRLGRHAKALVLMEEAGSVYVLEVRAEAE